MGAKNHADRTRATYPKYICAIRRISSKAKEAGVGDDQGPSRGVATVIYHTTSTNRYVYIISPRRKLPPLTRDQVRSCLCPDNAPLYPPPFSFPAISTRTLLQPRDPAQSLDLGTRQHAISSRNLRCGDIAERWRGTKKDAGKQAAPGEEKRRSCGGEVGVVALSRASGPSTSSGLRLGDREKWDRGWGWGNEIGIAVRGKSC